MLCVVLVDLIEIIRILPYVGRKHRREERQASAVPWMPNK